MAARASPPNPFADLPEIPIPARANPLDAIGTLAGSYADRLAEGSFVRRLLALTPAQRVAVLDGMSVEALELLQYSWRDWARAEQIEPPGTWSTWLLLAGRGAGKTRLGAEWIREQVNAGERRIVLVGRTAADVRDVIIFGESGIMAVSPASERPKYVRADRSLVWPNGATAMLVTAEEPDILRGPQFSRALVDEFASYKYPQQTWDNLQMCMRVGPRPRVCVTTTPRPTKQIRDLVRDPGTHLTRGNTFDNTANLPAKFIDRMRTRYEGTRLGRQELYAEILDDQLGALWKDASIARVAAPGEALTQVVVAVDPSVAQDGGGDACGIVAVGVGASGRAYVLEDASGNYPPLEWALRTLEVSTRHKAAVIVAEGNQGGALVETNIRTAPLVDPVRGGALRMVPIRVVHARVSKQARAEPVASLYEQGRVAHVGVFPELENEMTDWVPSSGAPSPNRLDALVWGLTHLLDRIVAARQPRAIGRPILVPVDPPWSRY